jgi:hypothetical protein
MTKFERNSTQRVIHVGRDERRVADRSRTLSPFGGVFNALKPLIS